MINVYIPTMPLLCGAISAIVRHCYEAAFYAEIQSCQIACGNRLHSPQYGRPFYNCSGDNSQGHKWEFLLNRTSAGTTGAGKRAEMAVLRKQVVLISWF